MKVGDDVFVNRIPGFICDQDIRDLKGHIVTVSKDLSNLVLVKAPDKKEYFLPKSCLEMMR